MFGARLLCVKGAGAVGDGGSVISIHALRKRNSLMDWILASASPRRKELFAELVDNFEILPSNAEEIVKGNPTPEERVKTLAFQKAKEVSLRAGASGKAVLGGGV